MPMYVRNCRRAYQLNLNHNGSNKKFVSYTSSSLRHIDFYVLCSICFYISHTWSCIQCQNIHWSPFLNTYPHPLTPKKIRFNRPYLIRYHIDIGPKFLGTLANLGQAFFLQVVLCSFNTHEKITYKVMLQRKLTRTCKRTVHRTLCH